LSVYDTISTDGQKIPAISKQDHGEQESSEERITGNDPAFRNELTLWIFRSVERSAAIYVLRAIKRTIRMQNASRIACVFVRHGSRGPAICDAEETAISDTR